MEMIPLREVRLVKFAASNSLSALFFIVALFVGSGCNKSASSALPTPEEAKEIVTDYLKKKSGASSFSSPIEVTKESLKDNGIWGQMKGKYDAPPNYETLYRDIGNDLTVIDKMFASDDDKQWGRAIRILFELCEISRDAAVDPWLSARICDAYLLPNLDKIEDKPKHGPDREQVMQYVARVYRNNEETDRLINLGKFYLTKFGDSKRADVVRWHVARALEGKGQKQEAVTYYKQITYSSLTNEAAQRIRSIEASTKAAAKK